MDARTRFNALVVKDKGIVEKKQESVLNSSLEALDHLRIDDDLIQHGQSLFKETPAFKHQQNMRDFFIRAEASIFMREIQRGDEESSSSEEEYEDEENIESEEEDDDDEDEEEETEEIKKKKRILKRLIRVSSSTEYINVFQVLRTVRGILQHFGMTMANHIYDGKLNSSDSLRTQKPRIKLGKPFWQTMKVGLCSWIVDWMINAYQDDSQIEVLKKRKLYCLSFKLPEQSNLVQRSVFITEEVEVDGKLVEVFVFGFLCEEHRPSHHFTKRYAYISFLESCQFSSAKKVPGVSPVRAVLTAYSEFLSVVKPGILLHIWADAPGAEYPHFIFKDFPRPIPPPVVSLKSSSASVDPQILASKKLHEMYLSFLEGKFGTHPFKYELSIPPLPEFGVPGEKAKDIKRDVDVIADHKQLQALAKSLVDKINSRFGTTIVAELKTPDYLKVDPRVDVTSFGIKDCTFFIDDGRFFDRQEFLDSYDFKDLPSAIKSTTDAIAQWKEKYGDGLEIFDCKTCFLSTYTS